MAKIVGRDALQATDVQKKIYFENHLVAQKMFEAGVVSEADIYVAIQKEIKEKERNRQRRSKRDH